jgi:hypothetical protein
VPAGCTSIPLKENGRVKVTVLRLVRTVISMSPALRMCLIAKRLGSAQICMLADMGRMTPTILGDRLDHIRLQ